MTRIHPRFDHLPQPEFLGRTLHAIDFHGHLGIEIHVIAIDAEAPEGGDRAVDTGSPDARTRVDPRGAADATGRFVAPQSRAPDATLFLAAHSRARLAIARRKAATPYTALLLESRSADSPVLGVAGGRQFEPWAIGMACATDAPRTGAAQGCQARILRFDTRRAENHEGRQQPKSSDAPLMSVNPHPDRPRWHQRPRASGRRRSRS